MHTKPHTMKHPLTSSSPRRPTMTTTTSQSPISLFLLSFLIASLTLTWLSNPCLSKTFLSIDCGGSDTFTDTTPITWVGDDDYVRNGESKLVEFSSSEFVLTRSLRAFPTLNKNCYTINVDKGDRLLVRASFFYGNYDGKNSPPTFNLYFDNNFWTGVNMSLNSDRYVAYEVIYTTNADTTNICLVQTYPNQFPFITALELRSLDANMYSHVDSNYAMVLEQRYSQGTNRLIRYPDDAYDRSWYPAFILGSIDVENEASTIDVSTAEDNPPVAVLQNANTFNDSLSGSLNMSMEIFTSLPNVKVGIYMTIYFSEVTLLPSTQKRSFQLFIDGEPYSKPIIPPFGSVQEIYVANITASFDTLFELRPTPDSTLPPLINANEVYSLSETSSLGTNPADVEGLAALQMQFEILQMWSGDPCLPAKYSWEWVDCSSDAIPRVTALNLSDFGLFGSLPDFSSMDALVSIDLHNNSLYGPIPDSLGNLPKLNLLDLSDNRFNGTVPDSLSSNKNLKLVVTENCLTGMSCPPPPPSPPPQPRKTHKINNINNSPPPPLPRLGFDFGNNRQGQSNFNFVGPNSGSKKSAELPCMVLGAMIQVFLLAFSFISF